MLRKTEHRRRTKKHAVRNIALTLSGPSFFQLLSSQGQIFLGLESVLQPALHFVTYLKEYLMDHVEIFRKHTLHILQHKDVINDDVTRSCDW